MLVRGMDVEMLDCKDVGRAGVRWAAERAEPFSFHLTLIPDPVVSVARQGMVQVHTIGASLTVIQQCCNSMQHVQGPPTYGATERLAQATGVYHEAARLCGGEANGVRRRSTVCGCR